MDKHKAQLASMDKAPNSDSNQDKHVTTHDIIPAMVGKCKLKNCPENSRLKGK